MDPRGNKWNQEGIFFSPVVKFDPRNARIPFLISRVFRLGNVFSRF